MEKEFKSCAKSDKHSVHKKLLILHKELLTKRFIEKYDENNPFISTHSNPSSAELEEILETIGIESDIFETKATYIDSSLLEKRHKVVHGERSDLDKEDFLTTFKIIIDLVEEYKTLLVNAADNKIYMRWSSWGIIVKCLLHKNMLMNFWIVLDILMVCMISQYWKILVEKAIY